LGYPQVEVGQSVSSTQKSKENYTPIGHTLKWLKLMVRCDLFGFRIAAKILFVLFE
jgi:hypothetical protein